MTTQDLRDEYARLGIDYSRIEAFKRAMMETARKTFVFPKRWDVVLDSDGNFQYTKPGQPKIRSVTEGLGHKNLIAEWMYINAGTGKTYHDGIGEDTMLMAVNDLAAKGFRPVVYTDEVAPGPDTWFQDEKRSRDLAQGFFVECERDGIALIGGESPAYPLLVNTEPYVPAAPVFSGCVVGIAPPYRQPVTGEKLQIGDVIIGVSSVGLHSNGSTLLIIRSQELPEQFLTKLPNGNTFGEEALIPTRSYVALVDALMEAQVEVHAFVPGTGGGVRKVAVDRRPMTYRIHSWVQEIPLLFQFVREEVGVALEDCLKTFNWGIGYYVFVPVGEVERTIQIGKQAGYDLSEVGRVEEGPRRVIFEPEGITLAPPGE